MIKNNFAFILLATAGYFLFIFATIFTLILLELMKIRSVLQTYRLDRLNDKRQVYRGLGI